MTLDARVESALRTHVLPGARVVAGLSGGIDSVVLLHALKSAAMKARCELAALHVNHQINPAAGKWARSCQAYCRKLGVPLTIVKVKVPRAASVEAAAREVRYAAFSAVPADCVVLAHNLDDQVETLLLQLLRGTGVKGASGMPVLREATRGVRSPGTRQHAPPAILRPLLDVSRTEILAYARAHQLKWVEDDSNENCDFDRNFLRHRVLPVIAKRYPAYRTTLARASRNFAEAAVLLDELARIDAGADSGGLRLATLRSLSAPRARNAVRHFLAAHGVMMPNELRLDECVRQARDARGGRFAVNLGRYELRGHAGELHVVAVAAPPAADLRVEWKGEPRLELTGLGATLVMKEVRGKGISLKKLLAAPVTVRLRQGGERLRPHPAGPRRSLKNLLQEARLQPWLRGRLPLLFCGESLVFVPGIGVAAEFGARGREAGVEPSLERSEG